MNKKGMKYKLIFTIAIFIANYANAQDYWNNTLKVGTDGVTEVGKYFDFHDTNTDSKDYSIRLFSAGDHLGITGGLNIGKYMLIDDPNYTTNWDKIWQCGFFQSVNKDTAPESNGWFWGINMGHTSNSPDYRYNGQIAIKNSPSSPTMYFRSTGKTGEGMWAKVLINSGNQTLDGDFDVDGTIKATEIKVEAQTADFVFEEDYQLKPLAEVEQFIQTNNHLPDIPSAREMKEDGVGLAEMNKLLLQKVEELTLYTIEQSKRLSEKDEKVSELEKRLARLEQLLTNL